MLTTISRLMATTTAYPISSEKNSSMYVWAQIVSRPYSRIEGWPAMPGVTKKVALPRCASTCQDLIRDILSGHHQDSSGGLEKLALIQKNLLPISLTVELTPNRGFAHVSVSCVWVNTTPLNVWRLPVPGQSILRLTHIKVWSPSLRGDSTSKTG